MKKLFLLLSFFCVTFATAQISDDPWDYNLYKRQYHLRAADDTGDPYFYFDGSDVALVGANLQINANGLILFNANNDITFETADGVLYLNAPTLTTTNTLTLPEDSGRVDNHNVTSLGQDAFTTTATDDTVTVAGALSTDMYFIQMTGTTFPLVSDRLIVQAFNGGFYVHRASPGTSGLTYNWRRFRQ